MTRIARMTALTIVLATCGCNVDTILNQVASFGPDGGAGLAGAPLQSGGRGNFFVFIRNNTPFRAIFSVGSFDNTDERTTPVFFQYSPDSQLVNVNSTTTLEGNSVTGILSFPCARTLSVGSRSLVSLIDENPGAAAGMIDEAGLVDGVGFSSEPLNSDDSAIPREGFASGFEALLGVDFNCGSLLNINLEFADTGPDRFLVELSEVFPAGRVDP